MSTFSGAYIGEIRILCEPSNPNGTHKVVLPVTEVDAIRDSETGRSLREILEQTASTQVIDGLTSGSVTAALSANQGRVLKLKINSLEDQFNSLTGFNITGAVDRFADLPDPSGKPHGTMFLVRTDETRGGITAIYEVDAAHEWIFLAEFTINLEGYVTTVMLEVALQNILADIEVLLSVLAPANTALSNTVWTNARAVLLDRLDATISSRAPANTALSNAQWTNNRAGLLDRLSNIPASGGFPVNVSVQRGTLAPTGVGTLRPTVTISSVNTARLFVMLSFSVGNPNHPLVSAVLTNSTTISIETLSTVPVSWQVVTFL